MSDQRTPAPPPREREALLKAIADSVLGPDNALPGLGQMAAYSFVLPTNVLSLPCSVVDDCVKRALEPRGLINWCNTIKRVQPVCTRGDGNCLLHAVSLYLWGVHDSLYVLRRLVSAALLRDRGQIRRRWQHEVECESSSIPGGVHLSKEEWQCDWDMVVRLVSDSDGQPPWKSVNSLEAVHVFAIANVLRRPVLVYGEAVVRDASGYSFSPNNIVGAYLPLLSEPAECTRSPILLAFHNGHFVPLLSVDEDAQTVGALAISGFHAAPMVLRSLEPLRLHFLLPNDEPRVFELLHSYLNLDEAPFTQHDSVQSILFARLTLRKLPDGLRAALPQLPCQASWSVPADDYSGTSSGSSGCAFDYSRIDGPSNFGHAPIDCSRLRSPAFATAAAVGAPSIIAESRLAPPATVVSPVAAPLSKLAPVPAPPASIASVRLPANLVATAVPASATIASAPPLMEQQVPAYTASASSSSTTSTDARASVAPTRSSSTAGPVAAAPQPVVGNGSSRHATSSTVDTVDRPDAGNSLCIASRASSALDLAPLVTGVRQLTEAELAALPMASLSGTPCLTDGCPFFSSFRTYPLCHNCASASRTPAMKSGAALASGGTPTVPSPGAIATGAADAGIATPVQQPMVAGTTASGVPVSSTATRLAAAAAGRASTPVGPCSSSSRGSSNSSRSGGSSSSDVAGQGRHRQPMKNVICARFDCQSLASTESYPYCPQCHQKSGPAMAAAAAVSSWQSAAVRFPAAGSANGMERPAGMATGSVVLPASGDCGQQQPRLPYAGDRASRPALAYVGPAAVDISSSGLGVPPASAGLLLQAAGGRQDAGSEGSDGSAGTARSSREASSSSSRAGGHRSSAGGREQQWQQLPLGSSDGSATVTDAKSNDVTELPIRDVSTPVSPTEETRVAGESSTDQLVRLPPPLTTKVASSSAEGVAARFGAYQDPRAAAAGPCSGAGAVLTGDSNCVHPECSNHTLPGYGGLCKECYDVIRDFKQKQRQKKTFDVPRCSYPNCETVGHDHLGGLCQNHYRP